MSPVGPDVSAEELAVKRESLALAAWHELLEGHEISVPVLVVEEEKGQVSVFRDIGDIEDKFFAYIAITTKNINNIKELPCQTSPKT